MMHNSLIIGAGQIAAGYDSFDDNKVLTHAHAYSLNSNINFLGFYDTNYEKALLMAEKWNTKAFKTLDEIKSVDIVSICTPDFCHLHSVKEALKLNPKIIFLEKPISNNEKDEKEIKKIAQRIPILVNFSRRYVNEFQDLSKRIQTGEFGKFQTGSGYYGKGFIHNGSHMLNLLELFFGKILNITEINEFNDFCKEDSTKTVILKVKEGNFFMQGVNCNNFTIFELDLIFEKARIRILNSGFYIEIYKIEEDLRFKGYKNLNLCEHFDTELDFAMKNAVDNIVNFLENKEKLICPVGEIL